MLNNIEQFDITVIIPTAGYKERAESLMRSIQSVIDQENVLAVPLVVLNGGKYDLQVKKDLENRDDILYVYINEGSSPMACSYGRMNVKTPYFSFLDDDDEYLPGCLELRMNEINKSEGVGVVVTNGLKKIGDVENTMFKDMHVFDKDPLLLMTQKGNWLTSCGALYRTSYVTLAYFDPYQKYFEWTITAYKLCIDKIKIKFVNDITFRIHSTEESLSKSENYMFAEQQIFYKLLSLNPPVRVVKAIRESQIDYYHSLSGFYLNIRDFKNAIIWHVKSLRSYRGIRLYIVYTIRIILNYFNK